jgi:hypothetical protein
MDGSQIIWIQTGQWVQGDGHERIMDDPALRFHATG